jgi:DNA polymerase III alpha subunit
MPVYDTTGDKIMLYEMGFMQVNELRRNVVDHLIADRRRNGAFRSFHDFLSRVKPDLAQACLLIKLAPVTVWLAS